MFRLLKCTVVYNSKYVSNQCVVIGSCGFHSSSILYRHKTQDVNTNQSIAYQPVADFYAGKSVFLTGGTGFLGKVFIEKLLSNCSEIDKIYVLIRGKKGAPAEQRLQKLLQTPVFTKLRNTKPEYFSKVVAIAGDMTEPDLGIKPEDAQTLIDQVSVVFHSAATVKFTEPFQDILNANVEGTRKVLNLTQRMNKLEILVHMSTAFSNSDKLLIDELIYSPPKKLEDVYYFVKNHGKDQEEIEKYIKGHANTYTFSKALAEALVMENRGNVPTIMVRPSIVSPALKEPLSGWVDSWVAGTALFADVARGLTRVAYGNKNVVMDMIPVDYVCNLTIAAAAKCPKSKEITVYHSCSSSTNPITWAGAADLFVKESVKFGYRELPLPKMFMSEAPIMVSALTFLLQTIPSFTADLWLRATGRKPKYIQAQQRAVLLRDLLKSFTTASFYLKTNNADSIISSMDEKDRQRFACDPRTINWKEYMPIYCFGVKQYLLSDKK
ncbi:putative fatty acyl-CoA reductase CG5065 [Epargyreus clarus]|uniref:putative fatty acyl-CoA reductase CG5065 n=1 Tax=Epargyreus clarus TaxID=520877 RepID=UPI003C2C766A